MGRWPLLDDKSLGTSQLVQVFPTQLEYRHSPGASVRLGLLISVVTVTGFVTWVSAEILYNLWGGGLEPESVPPVNVIGASASLSLLLLAAGLYDFAIIAGLCRQVRALFDKEAGTVTLLESSLTGKRGATHSLEDFHTLRLRKVSRSRTHDISLVDSQGRELLAIPVQSRRKAEVVAEEIANFLGRQVGEANTQT